MPFQKNHQYRWKPEKECSLDKNPICFKGRVGQKESLKNIPDWQDKLRDYVDELINKKPS
ncbi:hypothetical protein [Calothrix sp. UHCC 0171]|uniref:hypothetical protein n=1 Tax=Calothrix sp. UHCC 0171 TaxID=3110245 RepID=UPI002B21BD0B|nr:hypothetical protein [Calothrix sp. UHCC 0171]MEA5573343.1 hypothetical protein [Calothrix sp. UHCC 0171]